MEASQTPPQASSADHDLLVRLDEKVNTIIAAQQDDRKTRDAHELRLRALEKVQETGTGESKGKASLRDVLFAIIGIVVAISNPLVILWIAQHK